MKSNILLALAIYGLLLLSGCTQQSVIAEPVETNPDLSQETPEPTEKESDWLQDLITKEENSPVANPPAYLEKCEYENQSVYYLPSRCCDIMSVLFNETGDVICYPGGGFSGHGDGRCPDFYEEGKNCEVIWEDSRSYPGPSS